MAEKTIIGTREIVKAIAKGKVKKVVIAKNCPENLREKIPKEISEVGDIAKFKYENDVHDVSEDVYFWKQIKEKTDFKIVVDPTIQVGHVTDISINVNNFIGYHNYKRELMIKQMGEEEYNKQMSKFKLPKLLNGKKKTRYIIDGQTEKRTENKRQHGKSNRESEQTI